MLSEQKYYEELGARIRRIRKLRELTQIELANKLNVTSACLANYEFGVRKIPVYMILKMAEELKVSVHNIVITKSCKEFKQTV